MTTPGQDEKLRDLERRFRQTGSPDDEAAWLLERVRVGDLTQERLELAAYCGHEGARRAVGQCGPEGALAWAQGLARWGRAPCSAAALACARDVCSYWESGLGSSLPLDALERAQTSSRAEIRELALALQRQTYNIRGHDRSVSSCMAAAWALFQVAEEPLTGTEAAMAIAAAGEAHGNHAQALGVAKAAVLSAMKGWHA